MNLQQRIGAGQETSTAGCSVTEGSPEEPQYLPEIKKKKQGVNIFEEKFLLTDHF